MNHFLSLFRKQFLKSLLQVILRFPIPFVFSLIFVITECIWYKDFFHFYHFSNVITFGAFFGWIISFSITLFNENHSLSPTKKWLFHLFGIALAVGMGFLVFVQKDGYYFDYVLLLLFFSSLFFMLFIPFWGKKNQSELWDYHSKLFLSVFFSMIFSTILMIGLFLIIESLQFLFNFDGLMKSCGGYCPIFSYLLVFPLLMTYFTPKNWQPQIEMITFPQLVKVLVLYILLPIVCIYGVILYFYAIKILFTWELPKGQVSYMIIGFSIIGSLVWYLLYPIQKSKEKHWAKWYSRLFFVVLFPLLILLFAGLYRRLFDYGLTVNRYLLLIIACWLTVVDLLFIFKKVKRFTPLLCSLCIICLFMTFGPWNIVSFPRYLQTRQFEKIATEYQILKDGKIVTAPAPLTTEQNRVMSGFVDYLFVNENERYQQAFLEKFGDTSWSKTASTSDLTKHILSSMNGTYIPLKLRLDDESNNHFYSIDLSEKTYQITDYQYFFESNYPTKNDETSRSIVLQDLSIEQSYDFSNNELQFLLPDSDTLFFELEQPIKLLAKNHEKNDTSFDTAAIVYQENERFGISVALKSLGGTFNFASDTTFSDLSNLSFYVFVKDKRAVNSASK